MKLFCQVCKREWESRKLNPKRCRFADCRSMKWNKSADGDIEKLELLYTSPNYVKIIIALIRLNSRMTTHNRIDQNILAEETALKQPQISGMIRVLRAHGYIPEGYSLNTHKIALDLLEYMKKLHNKNYNESIKSLSRLKETHINSNGKIKDGYIKSLKDANLLNYVKPSQSLKLPTSENKGFIIFLGNELSIFLTNGYYRYNSLLADMNLNQVFEAFIKYYVDSINMVLIDLISQEIEPNKKQKALLFFYVACITTIGRFPFRSLAVRTAFY